MVLLQPCFGPKKGLIGPGKITHFSALNPDFFTVRIPLEKQNRAEFVSIYG